MIDVQQLPFYFKTLNIKSPHAMNPRSGDVWYVMRDVQLPMYVWTCNVMRKSYFGYIHYILVEIGVEYHLPYAVIFI